MTIGRDYSVPAEIKHFINGKFIIGKGDIIPNINPATGETIGLVHMGGAQEIDLAVEAAKNALAGEWGKLSAVKRAQLLRSLSKEILDNLEYLAWLETIDTGKPLHLSRMLDIPRSAYNFSFFADYLLAQEHESSVMDEPRAINYTIQQPVGVVGIITPWNLPLLLLTWKLAPCMAAGNTAVIKPSELTPLTAHYLAVLCNKVGIPEGVINIVHGCGEMAGAALSSHPDVNAITFTGESATGVKIMKAAAASLKKVSFELGGKNANIIFNDCNLDDAVQTSVKAAFLNQGEICLSGARILVEKSLYPEFVDRFVAEASKLIVGDPLDPSTNVGALISKEHVDKVKAYIALAKDTCTVLLGENDITEGKGLFVSPTIVVDVPSDSALIREEVFGPLVTIQPFDTVEEAIKMANDSKYGLSASVWTTTLNKAHEVAHRLETGVVWVNSWFLRDLRTPFGGIKHSGIGREGGKYSFDFYTHAKNICVRY